MRAARARWAVPPSDVFVLRVTASSAGRIESTASRLASDSTVTSGSTARIARYCGTLLITVPPSARMRARTAGVTSAWMSTVNSSDRSTVSRGFQLLTGWPTTVPVTESPRLLHHGPSCPTAVAAPALRPPGVAYLLPRPGVANSPSAVRQFRRAFAASSAPICCVAVAERDALRCAVEPRTLEPTGGGVIPEELASERGCVVARAILNGSLVVPAWWGRCS